MSAVDTGHWFCSVKMTDQLESFILLDYPSADLHQTSECLFGPQWQKDSSSCDIAHLLARLWCIVGEGLKTE